ncbi:MAG TPA: phenylalanine--tRNA ligase subunit beta [Gammaproteobacteria bacterium]|mgnify:CR=1 FL=1|nr:phenylalanine--tRNA ligase subunit beta [Gammaproteobacteria bacterium]
MIITEQWLRQWVDTDLNVNEIADVLTLAGLEVDAVEPIGLPHDKVIVGEIVSAAPHPDADRLQVCQVSDGKESFQVVCGAKNARVGIKVPYAMIGAELPDIKIKKAKLRGVESFGMLCSGEELGLHSPVKGLLELPDDSKTGQPLIETLGGADYAIDIDLTPNRGDCLSVLGVARELRVLQGSEIKSLPDDSVEQSSTAKVAVDNREKQSCTAYRARVIEGIDREAVTPLWLAERLRRSGIKPINPVVDVTNYVMLETGQPLHGFDRRQVGDGIVVRNANGGEKLLLLNGDEAELSADTLLIAREDGQPLAIAGVIGGETSGVYDDTDDVVLEAAHFSRAAIAGKARQYGVSTDSSHRYERGVDPLLGQLAIEYATRLMQEICGGKAGPIVEDNAQAPETTKVSLRYNYLCELLGFSIPQPEVHELLRRISPDVVETDSGWTITAPSYRHDMAFEADLVEEVARVFGYDRIPTKLPSLVPSSRIAREGDIDPSAVSRTMIARDYNETISYSFIDPEWDADYGSGETPVNLANPLSENMSVMRTSLLPGLLNSAVLNLNRQVDRIRLFEIGGTYSLVDNETVEIQRLGALCSGPALLESWEGDVRLTDFFDVKSELRAILCLTPFPNSFTFRQLEHKPLADNQVLGIYINGEKVGWLGRIQPVIERKLGFESPVYAFELRLDRLSSQQLVRYHPISKLPAVKRDLALVVDSDVAAGDIEATIKSVCSEELANIELFDVYQGDKVPDGCKSLAYRITLQSVSKTLTEEDIDRVVGELLSQLEKVHNATLR